mmetsp:Transcript_2595/g.10329  ORF Transcript_2595/g.10329 Transcript_2595/m.10329 type:complete len:210 (+) Transcript_2595:237-866(+)
MPQPGPSRARRRTTKSWRSPPPWSAAGRTPSSPRQRRQPMWILTTTRTALAGLHLTPRVPPLVPRPSDPAWALSKRPQPAQQHRAGQRPPLLPRLPPPRRSPPRWLRASRAMWRVSDFRAPSSTPATASSACVRRTTISLTRCVEPSTRRPSSSGTSTTPPSQPRTTRTKCPRATSPRRYEPCQLVASPTLSTQVRVPLRGLVRVFCAL